MKFLNSKILFLLLGLVVLSGFAFADKAGPEDGGETPGEGGKQPLPGALPSGCNDQICEALFGLCKTIKNALAVGMMFMVVTAALVYAIGQTMGAETRARATVWATSMFNGAIIAALILLIVPSVLQTLLGGSGIEANITC
ncbi:hypothetical protein HZC08_01325 [Candidatus Micrarchaeota archaeon]|nr:hypothetical protein [Candidatus Micrarchaeota archaeon]